LRLFGAAPLVTNSMPNEPKSREVDVAVIGVSSSVEGATRVMLQAPPPMATVLVLPPPPGTRIVPVMDDPAEAVPLTVNVDPGGTGIAGTVPVTSTVGAGA
jgi:hypothetical protein